MNRAQRRRNGTRSKAALISASLATSALVGYVSYLRPISAFANTDCVVTHEGLGAGSGGAKTLRDCIDEVSAGDTITFADSVTEIVIDQPGQTFLIDQSLTIDGYSGRSGSRVILDGTGFYQLFDASAGSLTLKDLVLKNAYSNSSGGALVALGTGDTDVDVYLEGVYAYDNSSAVGGTVSADGNVNVLSSANYPSIFALVGGPVGALQIGGAIQSDKTVTVGAGAEFKYLEASVQGGAIDATDVVINGGVFYENYAASGGSIFATGDVTVNSSEQTATFTRSRASVHGGAIHADTVTFGGGTVTGETDVIDASVGGAIYATSSVTINGGTFTELDTSIKGGAIYSADVDIDGGVEINGGTFSNNSADSGGSVYSKGPVRVSESDGATTSFASSSASVHGGAIHGNSVYFSSGTITGVEGMNSADMGGGIFAATYLKVSGGTFSYLEADLGGAVYSAGDTNLAGPASFESNRASNGGAIYSKGDITLSSNPTFSNNYAMSSGGAIFVEGAAQLSGPASFSSNGAGSYGGAIYSVNLTNSPDGNDITVQYDASFTDNYTAGGGGAVFAREADVNILGASVFEDNYGATQRGGAIYGSTVTISDAATFRGNSSSTGGAIYSSTATVISGDAEFHGNGKNPEAVIYADDGGAIRSLGTVDISGEVVFDDNYAIFSGGAIYATSDVGITGGGSFSSNISGQSGGAIFTGSSFTSSPSAEISFSTNRANIGSGGAIYATDALTITGKHHFVGNYAASRGGAVAVLNGSASITSSLGNESVFRANYSIASGGAVDTVSDLTVSHAYFESNDAQGGDGGAIYSFDTTTVSNARFTENYASIDGGAIYSRSIFDVSDSYFKDNEAEDGGAILSRGTEGGHSISNSVFQENSADFAGGAVYSVDDVAISSSTFTTNSASSGGAVYADNSLYISSSSFESNTATTFRGGAVWTDGSVEIDSSSFDGNTAGSEGGAVTALAGAQVISSLFSGNQAGSLGSAQYGGAIYSGSEVYLYNSTFYQNKAQRGSAVYARASMSSKMNFVTIYKNYVYGYSDDYDSAVYIQGASIYNSIISGNLTYDEASANMVAGVDLAATIYLKMQDSILSSDGSARFQDQAVNDTNSTISNLIFGNPRLSSLADNGGPTETLKPRFGSPAIDAADESFTQPADGELLRNDQRGELRVFGSGADIGAVEVQSVLTAGQFTLTSSAGAGGAISPATPVTVFELNDQTYVITPDANFQIASVTVDGVEIDIPDASGFSYTFEDIFQNHSIVATFEAITHTITVVTGDNGTISPSTGDFNQGSDQVFTVTPDSGYEIETVTVDGIEQEVEDSSSFTFTFENIAAAGSIEATFVRVSQGFSAPSPSVLPTILFTEPVVVAAGDELTVGTRNWDETAKVVIDGLEAELVSVGDNRITFVVPDVDPGTYQPVVESSQGRVSITIDFTVIESFDAESQGDFKAWTKLITENQVKMYAKNLIGEGKVQFFVDGEEIAWVRAENTEDPKLRNAQGSYYLVRTVELMPGKQALEIYLDGERVWRAAYTLK